MKVLCVLLNSVVSALAAGQLACWFGCSLSARLAMAAAISALVAHLNIRTWRCG